MKLARVTKVYRESSQERHATEYNGAFAVDVVFVDSKLADTEEIKPGVFLTKTSEDDYSYPDEGSIIGVDTYEGTSISYVAHITPFQQLVPGLQPGQRQMGEESTHVLIDTEQSDIEIEADNVRVEGDNFKNTAGIQEYIASQVLFYSDYITKFISKGDIEFLTLAFLDMQAGRFSITGTENSSITAIQNLNFVVGLACQLVVGTDFSVQSSLGEIDIGNITTGLTINQLGEALLSNLTGDIGLDLTGLAIIENTAGGSLKTWLITTLNAIEAGITSAGGTFSAAPLIILLNLILK